MHAVLVPNPASSVQFISSAKKKTEEQKKKKKLTAPWKSFHLAIPKWHYHIQFGKGENENKTCVSDLNTGNWMCKTLWCLPSCTVRGGGGRRVTHASLTWSLSTPLKSVSAGRESYFWRVSDTNITIMSTLSRILANTAEHSVFPLISCAFLFCTAPTISRVVYNLIVAWKSAAISIILCAACTLSVTFMEMKIIQSITRNPRSFLICLCAASLCTSTTYTPWFNFLKANMQSIGLMRQCEVHGGFH